jgi:cysteinyl-tRNA synthetase
MTDKPELKLWNTLTRKKEVFRPINENNVRMYVCGPTVYDFAHIGNARPVIVFDVLNRLLRHLYGENHVTYVRNITDVDDKINARALRDFGPEIASGSMSLNDAIRKVTETTANQFQADVKALGCLDPDHQPRATEHIGGMIEMAQRLIDKGNAYVAEGREGKEVLFDVSSMPDYGKLSNRKIEDQQAGARIEAKDHKRNPGDFVLWKQSEPHEPGWPAHFHFNGGHFDIFGRPGWHIECSVMSRAHLGDVFDIHGGGLDLIFPHHENEIAQSCCANGTEVMANYWMHNGFLQLEGKKMSKSDGNFVTINELLTTTKFGGRTWPGEVLRLAMLMTHYREPIDFSVRRLEEAESKLKDWKNFAKQRTTRTATRQEVTDAISLAFNDLDFNSIFSFLDSINILSPAESHRYLVWKILNLLGFNDDISQFEESSEALEIVFKALENKTIGNVKNIVDSAITRPTLSGVELTPHAKSLAAILALSRWVEKNVGAETTWNDSFRKAVEEYSIRITPTESTFETATEKSIASRLAFLAAKNFAEADRIRDELAAQGIALMDYKDPETGERKTKWEVKR